MMLIFGCIILALLLFGYLIILALFYYNQNPSADPIIESIPSTITHSYLGKRGDMGNQLFQLACIIAAGKRSNANIVLPTRTASLPIAEFFDLSSLTQQDIKVDASFHEYDNYETIHIPSDGRTYDIRGYRQAYKYFEDYANDIRTLFTPQKHILETVKAKVPTEYIAIHIRRGDYIKSMHKIPFLREFQSCQLVYYQAGIKILRKQYPECPVLVCTDSPEWVTPLLPELDAKAVLSPTFPGIKAKFSDFCTLYLADAVIMANSTYSWWASYLHANRPIICPSPWWDPNGFIGTAMGLDGPYLHHPDWTLLDANTGALVREPHSHIGEKPDNNHETLTLYKLLRGLIL